MKGVWYTCVIRRMITTVIALWKLTSTSCLSVLACEGAAFKLKVKIPPPSCNDSGSIIVMISLLFGGYAGGHLNKSPDGSVVLWRGRAADPTVERGDRMSLANPLTDPPHGEEATFHRPPSSGAPRKGKGCHHARGGFQTSVCRLQTLQLSMALWNTPEGRDLSH